MRGFRNIPAWIMVLLMTAAIACAAAADPASEEDESDADVARGRIASIQAGYLVRLANYRQKRFVRWPEDVFTGPEAPIVIATIGDDPVGGILVKVTRDKRIDGRAIEVRRLRQLPPASDPEALAAAFRRLQGCHLLFIDASAGDRFEELRDWLGTAPVLTVSDQPGFARRGGMIEFVTVDDRIVMDINWRTTERSKLKLSAKLMSLARTLIPERSTP